ncbi:MAG TPA: serine/threonine-protein kinase [Kofleriaceae bacterium]|nr:serine/threonine-protein kinase [Kofleriaceae bacterium]
MHGSRRVVAPLQYRDPDRYEVLAEHGRGGIGRVQRAHDRELGRDVAIKELIKRGDIGEVRFLREAMITARLEHPGIVPIHEAGRWPDGTPFYVMKLVAGRSLKQLIEERASVDERIGLLHHVIAVADAVAYAHERDIIHRDLKPANVIAGDFGETVVIDWGLAKDLRASEEASTADGPYRTNGRSDLTVAGAVLGTPLYMSPEQARGEWVDQRTDVFAIGAMLWQLCSPSRVPPADPGERRRTLRRQRIDGDLTAIIMKALAPEPADRYRNAGELAADLKAFKSGARIAARQYSPAAMFAHWIRRHRVLAAAVGLVAALTIVASFVYVHGITIERDRADVAAARAESQRRLAATERDHARLAEASALLEKDPTRARQVLETVDLRTPEYALLRSRANHGAALREITVRDGVWKLLRHPVTSEIAVVTNLGELDILDVNTGELRPVDHDLLDAITDDANGWAYLRKPFGNTTATLASTTSARTIDAGNLLGADEGTLVAANGALYALDEGDLYRLERNGPTLVRRGIRGVAGSAHLLMICTSSGTLEITRDGVAGKSTRCASNPGDRPLAASGTNYAALLDPDTLLLVRDGDAIEIPTHVTGEYSLVLASSGLLGVADLDGKPSFVAPGSQRLELGPSHASRVLSVAADGDIVAWGFEDGVVIALDTKTRQTWKLIGHGARVSQLVVDARRARLLSVGREEIRVWSLTPSPLTFDRLPCLAFNAARSPDGSRVLLDCNDGSVREWTLATGELRELHHHESIAYGVVWRANAACSAGWDGRVLCTSGEVTREVRPRGSRVRRLVASPRGDELAIATDDGAITDATGTELYRQPNVPYALAFSQDGRRIASGGFDGSVLVLDTATHHLASAAAGHSGLVTSVAWRAGELWTAGMDGVIKRWREDGATPRPVETLREPGAVRFFRLASSGWSATVGGRTLVVHRDSHELRLDLERFVESCDVSADERYVAAGTSTEVVIVDLLRHAIATTPLASRGGYVGFANPGFLTVSNGTSLITVPLSSLDYIAYRSTNHETTKTGED